MNPQALLAENKNLREQILLQANKIEYLQEQIEWFKRQLFGQRSEKTIENRDQLELSLGLEAFITKTKELAVAAHTRKKVVRNGKDTITLPDNLPTETQILDIPEKEKEGKIKIGEEISQKLAHKPGSYYIKKIVRPKYALANGEAVVTHELPESIIPKLKADESLLAEIFTKKFADHLPLYRISEGLKREGIGISRQLLSQWTLKCGKALVPLYETLEKEVLASEAIFVDETPVDMQMPGKGKVHQGYMWVIATETKRLYHFKTNRKHENAEEILKGYGKIVHSDKYGAYENLANQKKFLWSPCWAHIRRKFYEAESGDRKFREWMLRKMRYLFLLEKVGWARTEEERLRIRQTKEIPIIEEIIDKAKQKLIEGKILPKSKFKEALGYLCGLIPYLKTYTTHPKARLDNNIAERAIRPLAIGRKNWLFVGSEEGGKAAAVLLSLVQTCRASGVNPRQYLEDVMRKIMSHSNQRLYELLPEQWAASKKIDASQPGQT